MTTLNPWEFEGVDYQKLFEEFGISPFHVKDFPELERCKLFRRGLIFGHRGFHLWWKDFKEGKAVSILTGIMPSGPFHLGHKLVIDQLVFYQSLGVPITFVIADVEARDVRRKRPEEIREISKNMLATIFALGLDKGDIYFQTNRSVPYNRLVSLTPTKTTFAEMEAIYGELTPGKVLAIFHQVADILHLELPEYKGIHRVLVPVGPDQDPHIRFVRDIAERIGFLKPVASYHKFTKGLMGGKMSSSKPETYIALDEPLEVVLKKISNAFTGGRNTLKEQKELGGRPEVCVVYELFEHHFEEDDEKLKERWERCKKGELMCGECKKELKERVKKWFESFRKRREKFMDKAEAFVEENLNYPF